MKLLPILMLPFLFVCRCKSNPAINSFPCKVYNDSAINMFNEHVHNSNSNVLQLDTIIFLLNKAIECDSEYFIALGNKLTVLTYMGKYKESINLIDKLLILRNNNPQLIIYKGIMYEKMGNKDSAYQTYNIAKLSYEDKIKMFPDSVNLIIGSIVLEDIMDGENKALNDIDKYINMYPEKNIFKEYRKSLIGFDRNEFINSYGIQEK